MNAPSSDNSLPAKDAQQQVVERNDRVSWSSRMVSLKKVFRSEKVCIVTAWFVGTIFAFALTALQGVPAPFFTDESSYLLSADTFASGRLTNPTHPMWHHFETYHVIHEPTYTAKYHPAQAMTLAIGQMLGHPIIGACLATGLSLAALMWMLTGWLPRRYFWLAGLFVIFHPGLQLAWGQSYWGGAVALAGGSLLLGAFARLTKDFQIKYAIIAAIGTVLLANSRPFEGAILTASVGLGLLWKLVQDKQWKVKPFLARVILPGLAVVGLGAGWMLTYNHAVTGNALAMPYKIHEAKYGWTPLFLWQTAGEKPTYRHPVMETAYVGDKEYTESQFKSWSDVVTIKFFSASRILGFYCGGTSLFAIFCLPWLLKKSRYKLAFLLAIPAFAAGMVTPWEWAHYSAPVAPLLLLLLLASWIEFWRRTRKSPMLRFGIVAIILMYQFSWTVGVYKQQTQIRQRSWAKQRVAIKEQLKALDGRDLVLVRYSVPHIPSHEWVYNDADIDSSEIVWAREISPIARENLIGYFKDRKVWVLDADAEPAVLKPYDSEGRSQISTASR